MSEEDDPQSTTLLPTDTMESSEEEERNHDIAIHFSKPPCYQILFTFICVIAYVVTLAIDILILYVYYANNHKVWFGFSLAFTLVPTILVQSLSLRWFNEDNAKTTIITYVAHLLCLGPVERYFYTIYNGIAGRLGGNGACQRYVTYQRDNGALRFIYSFLESSPQITLNLYIVLRHYMDNMDDGVHVFASVKLIVACIALGFGMVSFNSESSCRIAKQLKISSYFFQTVYRFFAAFCRVATLAIFALEFKYLTYGICLAHWIIMFYWLWRRDVIFFSPHEGPTYRFFETLWQAVMGYVYIFCYISIKDASNVRSHLIYYIVYHTENVAMIISWVIVSERDFHIFESWAIGFVAYTMIMGTAFQMIYYKWYHPAKSFAEQEDKGDVVLPFFYRTPLIVHTFGKQPKKKKSIKPKKKDKKEEEEDRLLMEYEAPQFSIVI